MRMASQLYPILFRDPLLRAPKVPDPLNTIAEKERQTICEVLLSEASSRENTNTIGLAQPLRSRRLGFSPRRPRSLDPVDKIGQLTGWRNGFPSTNTGFFCLTRTQRRPRSLLAAFGAISVPDFPPQVDGSPETIPDAAPWLLLCPGILSPIWRYEEANDGHEGIVKGASKENFYNIAGEPDEEPETKGIPRNIVIPFHPVCTGYGSSFTLPVPERRSSAQLKARWNHARSRTTSSNRALLIHIVIYSYIICAWYLQHPSNRWYLFGRNPQSVSIHLITG
ncbi:hypothetical protein DFH08DRAFT_1000809 [Mycena albidolilacea]|uniref:Uncharacterized protein n=1 Tax=Mycena albidolilacea TaxID=1033008 RepID=A0AAD6YW49_9AGAR|nr:hypothetical protein DFH08DRAFT_1000809 [Mycena albidolilacea]